MQSLTVGAEQQTVLRLLEGQETCNVEFDCWCCTADSVTVIGGQETCNVELDCWCCTADSVTVIGGTGNMQWRND